MTKLKKILLNLKDSLNLYFFKKSVGFGEKISLIEAIKNCNNLTVCDYILLNNRHLLKEKIKN